MQVRSIRKNQAGVLSANTFNSGICRLFYKKCLSEITSKRTLSQGIFLISQGIKIFLSNNLSEFQCLPMHYLDLSMHYVFARQNM